MISNPWSIDNTDSVLFSPNCRMKVQYYHLYEIKMGSPLAGKATIEYDSFIVNIDDKCGCPPIWSNCGRFVAIPVWTADMAQEIAVIDTVNFEMVISQQIFRVLHFSSFNQNILEGTDSPIHMPKNFSFNISQLKVKSRKKLSPLSTGKILGLD